MKGRWDAYCLFSREEEITGFWKEYYSADKPKRQVVFILGKGFDPRMLNVLELLCRQNLNVDLRCYLISFPYDSKYTYGHLVEKNEKALETLAKSYGFEVDTSILADLHDNWLNGIKKLVSSVAAIPAEGENTDIIIDVSALPRAIYFNIVRVLCAKYGNNVNIFAAASESVPIDKAIKEDSYAEPEPLWGFSARLARSGRIDGFNVSIPLLGEGREDVLIDIIKKWHSEDSCPILPFPSIDPRRSDDLLGNYQDILQNYLDVEPEQVAYAAEQNPFELYRIITGIINNYKASFKPMTKNICFLVPILTSKLQSVGALLAAIEYPRDVAIMCPVPSKYKIEPEELKKFDSYNRASEPFLMWITGEAYNEE